MQCDTMSWKWTESEGVEYYIRTTFEGGGYKVEMTDLQHTWSEDLGREQFVARGEEVSGGAIDLSTESQVDFIRERLENALDSMGKLVVKRGNSKDDGLTVELKVDLSPIPDPLNWRFELSAADHVTYMKELIHGLIGISDFLVARVNELDELIVGKDYNINQLQEKVTELGTKYVPPHRHKYALLPFDKEQWWDNTKQSETEEPLHITEALKNIGELWGYNGKGKKVERKRKPEESPKPKFESVSPSKKRKKLKIPKEKSPSPSNPKNPSGPRWNF